MTASSRAASPIKWPVLLPRADSSIAWAVVVKERDDPYYNTPSHQAVPIPT